MGILPVPVPVLGPGSLVHVVHREQTRLGTPHCRVDWTDVPHTAHTLVPLHRRSLEDYGEIMEIITIINFILNGVSAY